MNSITLTLPYPISANRYWKTFVLGKRVMAAPSAEAKAYKKSVAALCLAAGIKAPITGRVHIDVKLFPAQPLDWQKRMRAVGAGWDDSVRCIDLDNANKVLLDSLKDVVIDDDKWVRRLTAERMEPDAGPARVVVTVTAIATAQPQMELV